MGEHATLVARGAQDDMSTPSRMEDGRMAAPPRDQLFAVIEPALTVGAACGMFHLISSIQSIPLLEKLYDVSPHYLKEIEKGIEV